MNARKSPPSLVFGGVFLLAILYSPLGLAQTRNESIDEVYEKVKKEGGRLVLYIAFQRSPRK
jgi:hypothetical protein